MTGDPDARGRFVRLDDGDMHVVQDGKPGAPAVLLIHGTLRARDRLAAKPALARLQVPTLIVWGTGDIFFRRKRI